MVEGTDGLGGVTIPEPLEAALIRLVEQFGIFRQYAGRKAMSAPTDTVPRRLGGLQVFYPDEATALTASDLRLDKVTLTAKKYACLSELSTELNEDSVLEMISLLVLEMAAAKAEDVNGFLGDGTATYASTTGLAKAIADEIAELIRLSGVLDWLDIRHGLDCRGVEIDSGIAHMTEPNTEGSDELRYITAIDFEIAYKEEI